MNQQKTLSIGADDVWMLAAHRLLEDGELSRHLHARESTTDSEHDKDLIREEKRVARHVAALLYGYFPVPEAVQHRRSIDEGDAAQLLAALVPHVERLIEADLRPGYANIPNGGSLAIRAFTAERLLADESNPTASQDEQLLLLQNYLALHRVVSLLEAVERDPQCIWRIASGRAA